MQPSARPMLGKSHPPAISFLCFAFFRLLTPSVLTTTANHPIYPQENHTSPRSATHPPSHSFNIPIALLFDFHSHFTVTCI